MIFFFFFFFDPNVLLDLHYCLLDPFEFLFLLSIVNLVVKPDLEDREQGVGEIESLLQILNFRDKKFEWPRILLSQNSRFNIFHRIEDIDLILCKFIGFQQFFFDFSFLFDIGLILIKDSFLNCFNFGFVFWASLGLMDLGRFYRVFDHALILFLELS